MNGREIRAMEIISRGGHPIAIGSEEFMMPSQSENGKKYRVQHKEEWTCECPDFKYRHNICKHIIATQFWLKMRTKSDTEGLFDMEREILDKHTCIYCGSENVVKNGARKTQNMVKQRFMCMDCRRTFIGNKDFERFKGGPKLITLVMDLYFKGVSLRKIKDHVSQFYGTDIHHETIRRWIVRFTKKMNEYVDKFKPNLSDTWHADEQFVKVRTGLNDARGHFAYAWNVLDSRTRFLIASNLTQFRSSWDAEETIRKAKHNAITEPRTIITDKSIAYGEIIKQNFPNTKHYRYKGFMDSPQNNKIERFHGTFRERDKVMRGLKSVATAHNFAEAFRMYYNFIRPHEGLGGLTPAQASGINLNLGQNRWHELIKQSFKKI